MPSPSLIPIPEAPELNEPSVSLKYAYDKWLRDVDSLTRKRKGRKKSRRLAALRHLAQPTESSVSKQIQAREPQLVSRAKPEKNSAAASQDNVQKRRFLALAAEANYDHFSYEAPWFPGLAFFELLAVHARERQAAEKDFHHHPMSRSSVTKNLQSELANFPVLVPPTVLRLEGSEGVAFFFATDRSQQPGLAEKQRRSVDLGDECTWTLKIYHFKSRDEFESCLPWILGVITGSITKSEVMIGAAVLKTASDHGNHLRILPSSEAVDDALRTLWNDHEPSNRIAIQSYIQSKGATNNGKAWIARPVFRKKDQSATVVWVLTGTDDRVASTQWDDDMDSAPCQIVRCMTAQSWQEPRMIVGTLCQFLDSHLVRVNRARAFAEVVVDLIQDDIGNWWLLQVKAFQLRTSTLPPTQAKDKSRARSAPDRLETVSVASDPTTSLCFQPKVKWRCMGKFCFQSGNGGGGLDGQITAEPSGFLTKKELLSCEFYERAHRNGDASVSNGFNSFSCSLAFYLQHQLHKRDRAALYEPQGLCNTCLRRYYALRTEMNAQIGMEVRGDSSKHRQRLLKKSSTTRSLPSLIVSRDNKHLGASSSIPDILRQTGALAPPSYMDELGRIEQLLADGSREHPPECKTANAPSTGSDSITGELSKTTTKLSWQLHPRQDDRIEEMWQSLRLKPLPTATSSKPTYGYNSFSLVKEMQLLQELNPATTAMHSPSGEPHLVSVANCRRVFSDECFRESLVHDASKQLLHEKRAVRFVILPSEDDQSSGDQPLGRMALQTLALDVMQALELHGTGGYGPLPPVVEDAVGSGCLFMTLPVPN